VSRLAFPMVDIRSLGLQDTESEVRELARIAEPVSESKSED